MKTAQQIWESKRWPIRDGIYFANGTVSLLGVLMPWESSDKKVSINVLGSLTLDELEEFQKNETTHIGWNHEQSYADLDLQVFAGGGSHGSEGFIAVIQISTRHLVWLAYFDSSNPFEKVWLENGIVTAISNLRHAWHLPLTEPATLTVNISEK